MHIHVLFRACPVIVLFYAQWFVCALESCGFDANCPGGCYGTQRECQGTGKSRHCHDVPECYSCCGTVCCASYSDTCCGEETGVCCGPFHICHFGNNTDDGGESEYGCKLDTQATILFVILGTIVPLCICFGVVSLCWYYRSQNRRRVKVVAHSYELSAPTVHIAPPGSSSQGMPVAYAQAIPSGAVPIYSNVPVAQATVASPGVVLYPMHMQQQSVYVQQQQSSPPQYQNIQQYPRT